MHSNFSYNIWSELLSSVFNCERSYFYNRIGKNIFNCVCVCVWVCICTWEHRYPQSPEEDLESMKVGVTSSSDSPNESAGNWTCVHWRNNFHFSALSHLSIHNYFCILTIRKKEIRCDIKEMPLGKSLELNDKEKLDLYSQGSITEDVLFDCFLFREGQITRSKGDTLRFLVPCSHSTQV